jgi:hypothetical protein
MGPPVRVRDRHAEARSLTADIAHGSHVTLPRFVARVARPIPGGESKGSPSAHEDAHRDNCTTELKWTVTFGKSPMKAVGSRGVAVAGRGGGPSLGSHLL